MGNHEEFVLHGECGIANMYYGFFENDLKYVDWMKSLPRYLETKDQIFVHAVLDEESGDIWRWGTSEEVYCNKYP